MIRYRFAKWVFEKLFNSFIVSAMIVWGKMIGLNLSGMNMQEVYVIIVLANIIASIITYIVIPKPKRQNQGNLHE
ncbi:MAG: hypothetical protein QXY40_09875 [Candidatus Methanomethylicia archaeon]